MKAKVYYVITFPQTPPPPPPKKKKDYYIVVIDNQKDPTVSVTFSKQLYVSYSSPQTKKKKVTHCMLVNTQNLIGFRN